MITYNNDRPFCHPEVPEGKKRVRIAAIETDTDKATLVILTSGRKVWVPKSISYFRFGYGSFGIDDDDKSAVIDVDIDFYEQNINI